MCLARRVSGAVLVLPAAHCRWPLDRQRTGHYSERSRPRPSAGSYRPSASTQSASSTRIPPAPRPSRQARPVDQQHQQHSRRSRQPPLHQIAWVGLEVQLSVYARYTHNFTPFGHRPPAAVQQKQANSPSATSPIHHIPSRNATPFARQGGLVVFHPTSGGGVGLPNQARCVPSTSPAA